MKRQQYICDRCGKSEYIEDNQINGKWAVLSYIWSGLSENGRSFGTQHVDKHLCLDCAVKVGLDLKPEQTADELQRSIGERLVDIIQEINEGGD